MTKEIISHQLPFEHFHQTKIRSSQDEPFLDRFEAANAILKEMGVGFSPGLRNIFECMEIAEEEIVTAQNEHSNMGKEISSSFSILRPSSLLEPRTPKIYRAHIKEMLQRVVRGQTKKKDLEAATAAELCCAFCNVSQVNSLQFDAVAAYQKLFNQIFPDASIEDEVVIQESYPGRADEIIAELRRTFQQPR